MNQGQPGLGGCGAIVPAGGVSAMPPVRRVPVIQAKGPNERFH